MRHALFGLALAVSLVLAAPSPAAADEHHVIDTQVTRVGQFVRTDWTVQAGSDPLNRFHVYRVAKDVPPEALRAALVLLPPLGNGFNFFEVDENGDYSRSFVAFFAERNVEVWGYAPRTTGLVAGACESGAVDCSPMAHWGLQAVVEDATFLRGWIGHDRPVVVGGYSLGAFSTIATIDAHPGDYDGALILEGSLYSADPAVVALNTGFCAGLEAQLAAGQIYDDTTLPGVRGIVALAANDPNGPTPLPGFPPGTTNHQVMVFLLAVPQAGPLWPTADFIRCAGSVAQDRFFYSTDARVIAHSVLFNDYTDTLSVRDFSCSIAGDRRFTSHLGDFHGPVYLMGAGHGFLGMEKDLETLLGTTDVTTNFVPEFGHADHWFSANHRQILEGDILRWLDRFHR